MGRCDAFSGSQLWCVSHLKFTIQDKRTDTIAPDVPNPLPNTANTRSVPGLLHRKEREPVTLTAPAVGLVFGDIAVTLTPAEAGRYSKVINVIPRRVRISFL